MVNNLRLATVGALFLGLVVVAATTRAGSAEDHTNYLTFSRAVALPGLELAAGTYIFETPTSSMSNSIVRVSSRDRKKVLLTAFTLQVPRPRGDNNGKVLVQLGEAAAGTAPPIAAWYPIGENVGHQFIYNR
jgi:hypothetical protein